MKQTSNAKRHIARRILSGALSLAVVLSGLVTAAIPTRAAGGAATHYEFVATPDADANFAELQPNLTAGAKTSGYGNVRSNVNAAFYTADGSYSFIRLFRLINSVNENDNTDQVNDPDYHYGLTGYRTYSSNDLYNGVSKKVTYYKVPTVNLEMVPKSFRPLDTTNIGAANLSLVIAVPVGASSLNVAFDRRLQVRVSLDGTNYLSGKAEIRSAEFLGGGKSGSNDFQLFRFETDDLLSISGVAGETIQAIKVLPEGSSDCSGGNFYIHQMKVNTYATADDFNTFCPEEVIPTTTYSSGDELRKIVLAEALRTAQTQWTSQADITTISPTGSSGVKQDWEQKTYTAGTIYRAPIYDRETDASREQFWSQFDNYTTTEHSMTVTLPQMGKTAITVTAPYNAVYTEDDLCFQESHENRDDNDKVKETLYGNHPYGMDCQTFVFNSISRVSRTSAVGAAKTMGATRTAILGGLKCLTHPIYTDRDIVKYALDTAKAAATDSDLKSFDTTLYTTTNTAAEIASMSWTQYSEKKTQQQYREKIDALAQQVYKAYAAALPGDIAVHNMSNAVRNVHTRLVRSVEVAYTDDTKTKIDPANSKMYFLGQEGGTPADLSDDYGSYKSTARSNGAVTFDKLLKDSYVVYTLDEYQDGVVENAKVQAVASSKVPNTAFWNSGLHLSLNSNYRIIRHQVKLVDAAGNALFDSGLEYPLNPCATGVNYTSGELDALLNNLNNGSYKIVWEVHSGPLDDYTDTDVPVHSDEIAFTVSGRAAVCPSNHPGYTGLNAAATLSTGSYCLTQDITGTVTVPSGVTATLCLNGHSITSGEAASAIVVAGTLTLCNCGVKVSYVTGTSSAPMIIINGGTLNLHNGVFVSNKGTVTNGGGVYLAGGGTFNMKGGAIVGNTANSGGGVYVSGGTFNMTGGAIYGNNSSGSEKTDGGGGVFVNTGSFNLSGGLISDNGAATANGSGIYVASGSTLHMTGGTVSGTGNLVYILTSAPNVSTISGGSITNPGGTAVIAASTNRKVTLCGDVIVTGNVSSYGIVTINGGLVNGNIRVNALQNDQKLVTPGSVVIQGGSVTGTLTEESKEFEMGTTEASNKVTYSGEITITGGKFSAAMSRDALLSFVPEESDTMTTIYSVKDCDDGNMVYEVVEGLCSGAEEKFMDFRSSLDFGVILHADRNFFPYDFADAAKGYKASAVSEYGTSYNASFDTTTIPDALILWARGIAAKEMQDAITFTVKDSANKVLFDETWSVYQVAELWHGDEDTSDQTMLADMINYGNEARKAFNYHYAEGDVLPTLPGATAGEPAWGATSGVGVTNGQQKNVATTLSLRERIELNIYINNAAAEISNVKFNGVYYDAANYKVDTTNGKYTRVTFDNIPVVKAKGKLEFTVTMDDGTTFDLKYSIADYARLAAQDQNNSQRDLIVALQKYVDSVYKYFGVAVDWIEPDYSDDEIGAIVLPTIKE